MRKILVGIVCATIYQTNAQTPLKIENLDYTPLIEVPQNDLKCLGPCTTTSCCDAADDARTNIDGCYFIRPNFGTNLQKQTYAYLGYEDVFTGKTDKNGLSPDESLCKVLNTFTTANAADSDDECGKACSAWNKVLGNINIGVCNAFNKIFCSTYDSFDSTRTCDNQKPAQCVMLNCNSISGNPMAVDQTKIVSVGLESLQSHKFWFLNTNKDLSTCMAPTPAPTNAPTPKPTMPTMNPTKSPTKNPTKSPTKNPTKRPTNVPTKSPTNRPTTPIPTKSPTTPIPTEKPTKSPTVSPTPLPTKSPTLKPTGSPTTQLDGELDTKFIEYIGKTCDDPNKKNYQVTSLMQCLQHCYRHEFVSSSRKQCVGFEYSEFLKLCNVYEQCLFEDMSAGLHTSYILYDVSTGHTRQPTKNPTKSPTKNPTRYPTKHPSKSPPIPTPTPTTEKPTIPPPPTSETDDVIVKFPYNLSKNILIASSAVFGAAIIIILYVFASYCIAKLKKFNIIRSGFQSIPGDDKH